MGLLSKILRWLGGSPAPQDDSPPDSEEESVEGIDSAEDETASEVVIYDENLYERARTQWQFGDWESLAQIEHESLLHHPQRAKLALLVASGHQQRGDTDATREFTRLAQEWGASKKLVSQVLIAGVYNTLGKASALCGQQQRALGHFEQSLRTAGDGGDVRLLAEARGGRQALTHAGLFQWLGSSKQVVDDGLQSTNKKADQKPKFSSDANIDDFIADIAPFFRDRSIVYVDVGAYIGEVLLKILTTQKIKVREAHLIEPNPESFKKLQGAVKNNGISSCSTYHFGISNKPGMARFRAAKSMTKKLSVDIGVDDASNNIFEAECRRLDDIASLFTDGRVDLLKLDVEGEEIDVLRSAELLFKEQKIDVLYVEVGFNREGTQQTYFGELDTMLQNYGYRVFKIYEQKNEWIEDSPLLRRCNAAYMSSRFANTHPYKSTVKFCSFN